MYGLFNDVKGGGKFYNSLGQYKDQKIQELKKFQRITKHKKQLQ